MHRSSGSQTEVWDHQESLGIFHGIPNRVALYCYTVTLFYSLYTNISVCKHTIYSNSVLNLFISIFPTLCFVSVLFLIWSWADPEAQPPRLQDHSTVLSDLDSILGFSFQPKPQRSNSEKNPRFYS